MYLGNFDCTFGALETDAFHRLIDDGLADI
jgi:hypothetical protein